MDHKTARAEIREFLEGFHEEIVALRSIHHGESDEEIAAAMWLNSHRAALEKQMEGLKTVYFHVLYDIQQEQRKAKSNGS